jgi:polyisoprenoid-binding protein YceI
MWRTVRWVVGAVVALVVAVSAGTWLYLNVVRDPPPERLTLDSVTTAPSASTTTTASAAPTTGVEGRWRVGSGSEAGYRVPEVLNGQRAEAVGRTAAVTGELTIASTQATAASFTVDLATVASDENRRDNQFRGRIMDVASHPDATFVLGGTIALPSIPDAGGRISVRAGGRLTLRGVTRDVTFDISAERSATGFTVAGSIPITFSDFGIPNPSAGPAQVGDEGELEFLLVFVR